ncbi:cytochrome C assembly family protein [Pectobacterium brasiliense]|uniref:cytochrome C assembly family protein n=1 Tax=Pectobacterium brasiliense TaxID=180957 RepID=UPI0019699838|nr:inner membrane protein YpjD [Pectobacterium brasiliense]MBN3264671.1 inner membrane protein YpjD [Pectobacterium brasiliense]
MSVFAIVALVAYTLSLGLIIPSLLRKNSAYRRLAILSASAALICHAVALYQRIFDVQVGQNLSLLNIGSLVSLIICTVMTLVATRDRGWFILPIVYTFALINLAFASFMPSEFITHLEASPGLMIHIGLALFSYATLLIAALYALQLAWLDYLLKNKKLGFAADMPPLMGIERKMFHITQIGVILLTLTLCTGLFYMDDLIDNKENLHKAVFSLFAWFIYILLLWGHYHEGWRGRRVVWFSLIGALMLTLSYFGSRVIQHFLAV